MHNGVHRFNVALRILKIFLVRVSVMVNIRIFFVKWQRAYSLYDLTLAVQIALRIIDTARHTNGVVQTKKCTACRV